MVSAASGGERDDVSSFVAALRGENDAAAREQAAAELLKRIDAEAARSALQSALWDDRPAGTRRAVALAIAEMPEAAGSLVRSLGTALADVLTQGGPEADALALLRALSRFSTRQAVSAVIESALPRNDVSIAVRSKVFSTLAWQTARHDLGENAEAWQRWWARVRWFNEREWEDELTRRRVERGRGADAALGEAAKRQAELYRRVHALTPEEGRDRVLVEMLTSGEAEVRRAGFAIVMLALLNARPIGESVAEASASRLSDPLLSIRADAARVVELVDHADLFEPLWEALEREKEPMAAAAMLRASARHPDAAMIGPALRWMSPPSPGAARAAAGEALLAAHRAGLLGQTNAATLIRASLEGCNLDGLPVSSLRLAAVVGLIEQVAEQLQSADRASARAAAEALSEVAEGVDPLLAAAESHPDLFAAAARAVQRHRATAEGYRRVASLPAGNASEREALLREVSASLEPDELSRLASSITDVAKRESLLSGVVSAAYLARPDDLTERVELALMLARARLLLRRPADALAVLELLPTNWQGPRAGALRFTAFLCLGRVEDAAARLEALAADESANGFGLLTDAWLDAVELTPDPSMALRIVERFEPRFASGMTAERAERLRTLKQGLRAEAPRGRE